MAVPSAKTVQTRHGTSRRVMLLAICEVGRITGPMNDERLSSSEPIAGVCDLADLQPTETLSHFVGTRRFTSSNQF